MILRHPLRVALNPLLSTAGWVLPELVSGSVIVASILGLPLIGPLLLEALRSQDMYLAGALILLFGKFLIGKDGNIVKRFEPPTAPDAPEVIKAIEEALAAK